MTPVPLVPSPKFNQLTNASFSKVFPFSLEIKAEWNVEGWRKIKVGLNFLSTLYKYSSGFICFAKPIL